MSNYSKKQKRQFFGGLDDEAYHGVITRAPRDLIVYKKTVGLGGGSNYLTTLLVRKGTEVRWRDVSIFNNESKKCRATHAKVLSNERIINSKLRPSLTAKVTRANRGSSFEYKVGRIVRAKDREGVLLVHLVEPMRACDAGIHFFLTKGEAIRYNWG